MPALSCDRPSAAAQSTHPSGREILDPQGHAFPLRWHAAAPKLCCADSVEGIDTLSVYFAALLADEQTHCLPLRPQATRVP